MRVASIPSPIDAPARYVMTLWSLWVDPIEAAFADLAAEVELEALRQRRRGEQGPASAAAGAQELGNQEA